MTLDSQVIEAEKIEHMPRNRSNLRKSLIISTVAHLFLAYLAFDFGTSGPVARYNSLTGNKNGQKAPITVSLFEDLFEDSEVYETPRKVVGFNHDLFEDSEVYEIPRKVVDFAPELRRILRYEGLAQIPVSELEKNLTNRELSKSSFQVHLTELPKELEGIVAEIPRTFEGYAHDKNLRLLLEKTFKETYSPNERNFNNYERFFSAYGNTYVEEQRFVVPYEYVLELLPIKKRNSGVLRMVNYTVRIYSNGSFEFLAIKLGEGFIDENGKVLEFYRRLMHKMPRTFMPPEVAGLQSPLVLNISELNNANPNIVKRTRYVLP